MHLPALLPHELQFLTPRLFTASGFHQRKALLRAASRSKENESRQAGTLQASSNDLPSPPPKSGSRVRSLSKVRRQTVAWMDREMPAPFISPHNR